MGKARGQERALSFLHENILLAVKSGNARLPSVQVMAGQAGVAPLTMWKAVRLLCTQGRLTARQRQGIHVVSGAEMDLKESPAEPVASRSQAQKWQRLCTTIEGDIVKGVHPPGVVLPSIKQLRNRYGFCFQTVKRALLSLHSDGVIEQHKNGYRVPAFMANRVRSTIIVVGWMLGDEVMRALDAECYKTGITLNIIPLFPRDQLFDRIAKAVRGCGGDAIMGSIISITGGSSQQYQEMIRALLPLNRPVAVLDQYGGALDGPLPGGRSVRVFSIANSLRPGWNVGRFLLGLGHSRVVYLSSAHEAMWSQNRLAGLADALGRTRSAGMVIPVTASYDFAVTETAQQEFLAEFDTRIREFDHKDPALKGLMNRVMTSHKSEIVEKIMWAQIEMQMEPLIRRALEYDGVTAWVAGNDRMALACLDWLQRNGIDVPGKISLIGFDDITAAFEKRLTSYNFNRMACVHAVLAYLLGEPQRGATAHAGKPVEIDGFVAARNTTGPAG